MPIGKPWRHRAAATLVVMALLATRNFAVGGPQAVPPSASALAIQVQAHYATVRDFTADFTQEQSSRFSPTRSRAPERGSVRVKKPSRMRWTYATADRKEFIADGRYIYSYFPRDKYVVKTAIPPGDQAPTALLFLTGRGDLVRDFTASMPGEQVAGEWRLTLRPKAAGADFSTLTLEVDRQSLALRGFTIVDDQGEASVFRLTNLRENRGLSDGEFAFTLPKGVEIR